MASGLLPKSPVSSSLCDEVPHIFIPKSHLEPREFLISSAKRLLQQYRHKADIRGTATICQLLGVKRTTLRHTALRNAITSQIPERVIEALHWGRELQAFGHTVKLMPPSYVKAYLKRSKNDANEAAAICEWQRHRDCCIKIKA